MSGVNIHWGQYLDTLFSLFSLYLIKAIMDRIYKSVWDKVDSSGPFAKALFSFAYEYKKRNLRRGMDTPLLNR